ncbi:hypothetical protein X777_01730 [Ooceraea biroi]|uniref:Uncharacterized protein n=1 Tax=Ooceraea biroi TaxID=2015173 RepID=A0A026WPX1_OOCBI|nr:hypothetical protein X777_01730 [Ooceraea biroi]
MPPPMLTTPQHPDVYKTPGIFAVRPMSVTTTSAAFYYAITLRSWQMSRTNGCKSR